MSGTTPLMSCNLPIQRPTSNRQRLLRRLPPAFRRRGLEGCDVDPAALRGTLEKVNGEIMVTAKIPRGAGRRALHDAASQSLSGLFRRGARRPPMPMSFCLSGAGRQGWMPRAAADAAVSATIGNTPTEGEYRSATGIRVRIL